MAKPAANKPDNKPTPAGQFIPTTDKRALMFFLLGTLQGKFENANLLTELVIDQTAETPTEATE